ncbi:MAG: radical SAM protein [Candidatus Zixiibacteriota bacterium]
MSLTGGEPLAWPEFSRAFAYAQSRQLRMGLVTNGWLFTEVLEPILRQSPQAARVLSISFSLDGPDADTHDHFRRRPGSFERILRALSACRELGVTSNLKSSLWRRNTDRLLDLIALAQSYGSGLSLIFLSPTPELVQERLIPDPGEYERLFHQITSQLLPLFPWVGVEGICSLDQPIPLCNPFMSLPSIAYDGTATLCCNLSNVGGQESAAQGPDLLGNVDRDPLPTILERHLAMLPDLAAGWTDRPDRLWKRSCAHCLGRFGKLGWLARTDSPWRQRL